MYSEFTWWTTLPMIPCVWTGRSHVVVPIENQKWGRVDGYLWFFFVDSCWCGSYKYFLLPTATPGSEEVLSRRYVDTDSSCLAAFECVKEKKGDKNVRQKKSKNNNRAVCVCQSVPRGRCCRHTCIQSLIMATSEPGDPSKSILKRGLRNLDSTWKKTVQGSIPSGVFTFFTLSGFPVNTMGL